jgi:hypothetical protein
MPVVGPDGLPRTDGQPQQLRTDLRPAIVAPVNELADRIAAALPPELLRDVDPEVLRCAFNRLWWRTTLELRNGICRGRVQV